MWNEIVLSLGIVGILVSFFMSINDLISITTHLIMLIAILIGQQVYYYYKKDK